ncbi:cytochrome P450 [Streptomyces sp. NPDC044571]|uniref:cytochrome P450 n=1 Tax=Streptomyces sp. NPDC044571 TaxID=3155371 RepID=UPI0033D139E6
MTATTRTRRVVPLPEQRVPGMSNTRSKVSRASSPTDRALLRLYQSIYITAAGVLVLVAVAAASMAVADLQPWIFGPLAAVAGSTLVLAYRKRHREFCSRQHIPGPKPAFFMGNLADLLAFGQGHRDLALRGLHEEYGPIVRIHLGWGSRPYVSVNTASKNLHQRSFDSNRQADGTVLPISMMGMPGGEELQSHRRSIGGLLNRQALGHFKQEADAFAVQFTERNGANGAGNPDSPTALLREVQSWSANALGRLLFGTSWRLPDLPRYLDCLGRIEEEIGYRTFHPPFRRFIFLHRTVQTRSAYRYLASTLSSMSDSRGCPFATKSTGENRATVAERIMNEGGWKRRQKIEELMSLVLGGTDAMTYAITQSLIELAHNPEIQRKVQDSWTPTGDGDRSDNKAASEMVRAVFYETLRLHPPVPFSSKRSDRLDVEAGGILVPAGTNLLWAKAAIGVNPEIFDDPLRFDPSRFEEGASLADFLPFGAGPRHCIGSQAAEQLCIALLSHILRAFSVEPVDDADMTLTAKVAVAPSCIPVRLQPLLNFIE